MPSPLHGMRPHPAVSAAATGDGAIIPITIPTGPRTPVPFIEDPPHPWRPEPTARVTSTEYSNLPPSRIWQQGLPMRSSAPACIPAGPDHLIRPVVVTRFRAHARTADTWRAHRPHCSSPGLFLSLADQRSELAWQPIMQAGRDKSAGDQVPEVKTPAARARRSHPHDAGELPGTPVYGADECLFAPTARLPAVDGPVGSREPRLQRAKPQDFIVPPATYASVQGWGGSGGDHIDRRSPLRLGGFGGFAEFGRQRRDNSAATTSRPGDILRVRVGYGASDRRSSGDVTPPAAGAATTIDLGRACRRGELRSGTPAVKNDAAHVDYNLTPPASRLPFNAVLQRVAADPAERARNFPKGEILLLIAGGEAAPGATRSAATARSAARRTATRRATGAEPAAATVNHGNPNRQGAGGASPAKPGQSFASAIVDPVNDRTYVGAGGATPGTGGPRGAREVPDSGRCRRVRRIPGGGGGGGLGGGGPAWTRTSRRGQHRRGGGAPGPGAPTRPSRRRRAVTALPSSSGNPDKGVAAATATSPGAARSSPRAGSSAAARTCRPASGKRRRRETRSTRSARAAADADAAGQPPSRAAWAAVSGQGGGRRRRAPVDQFLAMILAVPAIASKNPFVQWRRRVEQSSRRRGQQASTRSARPIIAGGGGGASG